MKEQQGPQISIYFSSHQFDYRKGRILKSSGEEIFMEHRLKELLFMLLRHKNEVVTRDELMAFVWKDVIVSDESITKAVSDLRKFFVQQHIEGLKIVTIRKLGYRLEVEESVTAIKKKKKLGMLMLKGTLYIFLAFLVFIILIRAINYG